MIDRITPRTGLILLAVLTLIRLAVAALTPLSPDEAYYWVWSQSLAAGYLDHPPMVALWIRAGVALAGDGPLGVRMLAPFAAALGSLLLYQAARSVTGIPAAGMRAALLLNATLLFGAGAVTMTPDTPLLFFWTLTLWGMGRLVHTGRALCWLVIGAAVGLAFLSKYTAVVLPAGIVIWLCWTRGYWRWLVRPSLWMGVALGVVLFVPTLLWNQHHHWISFIKQGSRNLVFHPAAAAGYLAELLGGQFGLATPIIAVLCAVGIARATRSAWRQRHPGPTLVVAMALPAVALFVEHAFGDRVQPNWPAIIYPAAAIGACYATGKWLDRLWLPGLALGFAMTALVYVQAAFAPLPLSAKLDPTLRLSGGYGELAKAVTQEARRRGASFVAVDDYGPASLMAQLEPGCLPVIGLEPRWFLFDLPDGTGWMDGKTGLLLRSQHRHDAPRMSDWSALRPVGTLPRARNGQLAETYTVYQGIGRVGTESNVLLPCGRPDAARN